MIRSAIIWIMVLYGFLSGWVAAGNLYVTPSGNNLVYNGQTVVLRGENFNNGPALAPTSPDINLINANESDYAQVHDLLGANVIRFGLDYGWYTANATTFFTIIDQHVAWAKKHHLWMIPVLFIAPGATTGCYGTSDQVGYWSSSTNMNLIIDFWRAFATHYANEPTIAGYDIFNEPSPSSDAEYTTWVQSVYNTITAVDPNHFVAVETDYPNGGSAVNLPSITDANGPLRILWSTHCYGDAPGGGCTFASNSTLPSKLPLWVGEMGATGSPSGGTSYVPGNLTYYNSLGLSWCHFVMHSWYSASNNYGLYNDEGAGNFSHPWTAMIQVVQAATQGNIFPSSTDTVISVSPVSASVAADSMQQFTATVSDNNGPLPSQPTFTWTVSGGGSISSTGLFTAGSTAGGPYTVTATAGAKSGTASVTVTKSNGGTIGYNGEGTGSDNLNDANGCYINVARSQAMANLNVTNIKAKVRGITGKYKCAIYSDNAGLPDSLLKTSTEVVNPAADGWQTFTLTSTQHLQNGSSYWLAIWSDVTSTSAGVYYNPTGGTLRWTAGITYGTWPATLSTISGSNYQYCIYAEDPGTTAINRPRLPDIAATLGSARAQINIYNNAGSLVRTITGPTDQPDELIKSMGLPNGLYFYTIAGEKGQKAGKLLLLK